MGSVSPLLAVYEKLKDRREVDALWLGTSTGPEAAIVGAYNIKFSALPAGKFRRYFDWHNLTDIFLILFGFLKSLWLVYRFKPDLVLTAGSYVCVPVAYAAKVFKKRLIVHQQDLQIGLANKLMQPLADKITLAVSELRDKYSQPDKLVVTGNPTRDFLFHGLSERAVTRFSLAPELPVLLIMGGGVGSEIINKVFIESAAKLTEFCQVIHAVGKGDQTKWLLSPAIENNRRYHAVEFLGPELADVYAATTVFFGRAGFGTLTELAALGKPAVVMPIPDNQQEKNAEFFHRQKAVVYVRQADFSGEYIINLLADLLSRPKRLSELSLNIQRVLPEQAADKYAELICDLLGEFDS